MGLAFGKEVLVQERTSQCPPKGFMPGLRSAECLLHPKALQGAASRDRWSVTDQSPGSHRILSPG